jgi:putative tricarboxylic transport membrane protein
MVLCVIGAFGLRNSVDDLYIIFACGIIGYFMRKLDYPIAPAVLGLVLGDRAELSMRRSILLSLGDALILVSRPISATLLALAAFPIVYPIFKRSKMFRESSGSGPKVVWGGTYFALSARLRYKGRRIPIRKIHSEIR